LSYPLGVATPRYRDNPPVRIWPQYAMAAGDGFNQYFVMSVTHSGTHMDCPRHFNPLGPAVADLPLDFFVFEHPVVLDLPKTDDELIGAQDLEPHRGQLAEADLLLIRTGFGLVREADPERYGWHNPGFDASAGRWLVSQPKLRAVGMDTPSASAAQHLDQGIRFHEVVLGRDRADAAPFVILEDVNLRGALRGLERVYAIPLIIQGVDSSPCTIVAELSSQ
jgi:arylformamidase